MASPIVVVAIKTSAETAIGIGLTGNGIVKISTISSDGLFAGTDLKVGMVLESVDNTKCVTAAGAICVLRAAEGSGYDRGL